MLTRRVRVPAVLREEPQYRLLFGSHLPDWGIGILAALLVLRVPAVRHPPRGTVAAEA